jgi:hypothetical protein
MFVREQEIHIAIGIPIAHRERALQIGANEVLPRAACALDTNSRSTALSSGLGVGRCVHRYPLDD